MRIQPLLILVIISTIFSGCTTVPQPKRKPEEVLSLYLHRKAAVDIIKKWNINSRAGFSTANDSGSVSMLWKQKDAAYHISLIAPLGQGRLDLYGEDTNVVLKTSDGKTLYGESAQELIKRATGFTVPVANLEYWIKGLPGTSKVESLSYNNDGTIASMQQSGWDIKYLDYQTFDQISKQTMLPRKLQAINGNLKIKIVIKEWNTDE
ncbi:MAG: outer membrane lipoprotein LolB [Gammaproteobacteria bacterium]|nr:MAG: outer membrane lipoprotein LolB [Gammaproteobacteria bacterium]